MDSHQLPKRLNFFLEDLYKEFPFVKKHPDYNFYYLYIDKPEVTEYLFCKVDDFLHNSFVAVGLNKSMLSKASFYNFTEASILNYGDFSYIERLVEDKIDELKKTDGTVLFYQVW